MAGSRVIVLALMLSAAAAHGQDRMLSVVVRGNLTTGSELFPNAGASDPVLRAFSRPFDNIPGAGLEVRYYPPGTRLAFGLSADYLRARTDVRAAGTSAGVPAADGFRVVPVEVTGYVLLPLTGSSFGIYMGGGLGGYFGRRLLSIAGVNALPRTERPGFGIHVLGGVEVSLGRGISLTGEMKFRDVQFRSTAVFPVVLIIRDGVPVYLSSEPQVSTVHADGVVFQLGACISW